MRHGYVTKRYFNVVKEQPATDYMDFKFLELHKHETQSIQQ